MKQKKITRFCGRYRSTLVYNPITINDIINATPRARAEKSKVTTEARKIQNDKSKRKRLEALLYGNFTGTDYLLTLTYDEAHTPKNKKEARPHLKEFLKQLRFTRSRRRQILKYIYTTEGKHGEKRIHHHIVINAVSPNDLEDFISIWKYCSPQGIDIEQLETGNVDITDRAYYMTKEEKENGEQSYTCSRNLERIETITEWVDESETVIIPPRARPLRTVTHQTRYGSFTYIEYLLPPEQRQQKPAHRYKTE